jgi:hypothetical protein
MIKEVWIELRKTGIEQAHHPRQVPYLVLAIVRRYIPSMVSIQESHE